MDQHLRSALQEAENLLQSGETQAAQSALVRLLQKDPDFEQGWFALSFTGLEPDQKIYALRQALRINPGYREAQERLNTLEKQATIKTPESMSECDAAPPLMAAARLINSGRPKDGDPDAAGELLREILRDCPEESQAWYLLSFTEPTRRGQVNALRQALRIEPGHPAAIARLEALQQTGIRHHPPPITRPATRQDAKTEPAKAPSTFWGLTRYVLQRGLMIMITIVIGVYISVLITNKGGQIDNDVQQQINREIQQLRFSDRELSPEQLEARRMELEEEIGLNLPPFQRNLRWTYNALTFQWGKVVYLRNLNLWRGTSEDIDQVRSLILQYLPNTLLLFGAANLLVLLVGIPLSLFLASRGKNSRLDRFVSMMSPLSSVPSWVHGILLVTIFAVALGVLPYGGKYDNIPPDTRLGYIPIVAKHMVLPVAAIFLSMIFQLVYSWRTYFLIYSDEDYVELARAKGLPIKLMERRYILRPTMPYIVTGFALTLVGFWQMSTALETFFNWPGIGMLYVTALPNFWGENFFPGEVSIILSVVVMFAYLLGLVVFLLDGTYAILDPRVRLQQGSNQYSRLQSKSRQRSKRFWQRRKNKGDGIKPRTKTRPQPIPISERIRLFGANLRLSLSQGWTWLRNLFGEIRKYPSAIIGLTIICILVGASIYTVIALPYLEIGSEWRGSNISERTYLPKNVPPAWTNWFRKEDYPPTMVFSSQTNDQSGGDEKWLVLEKTVVEPDSSVPEIIFKREIDYPYTTFPLDVYLYIDTHFIEKRPHLSIAWTTPDGREINPKSPTYDSGEVYDFSENVHPQREVRSNPNWQNWFVTQGQNNTPFFYYLFADPEADTPRALPGTYQIEITATTFEQGSDVDLELVLFGGVHGLAGTDFLRRDLTVPLLWGLPFTLAFGVTGAVLTTALAMIVAAAGVWFGGWLDGVIQRITEANMILPVLAVGILVFAFYGISLWVIMGVIILLNVFGSPTKSFRAAFLQIKEAPYVEAARTYGASNARIIFRYMIPKIVPVLIPQLVMLIPALVFLEATLGIFNVFDPRYPTWGRVIYEAITRSALWGGSAYWYLEPIGLLLLVGMAFALLGFALERILNPRLQGM